MAKSWDAKLYEMRKKSMLGILQMLAAFERKRFFVWRDDQTSVNNEWQIVKDIAIEYNNCIPTVDGGTMPIELFDDLYQDSYHIAQLGNGSKLFVGVRPYERTQDELDRLVALTTAPLDRPVARAKCVLRKHHK